MNHKPEDILAIIRDIHPHLGKLLGSEAQVVEAKLAQINHLSAVRLKDKT